MDRVEKNLKIAIAYTLKDTNGRIIEEIPPTHPVVYLHGISDYVPQRLQDALEGLRVGERIVVTLSPEEAYGPYLSSLIIEVPKEELRDVGQLWVGMEIEMVQDERESPENWKIPDHPEDLIQQDDEPMIYVIREIREETVILDGNHPLAGMSLTFDVQVVSIQQPTISEIEQGYPDDPHDGEDNQGDGYGWGGQDFGESRRWH